MSASFAGAHGLPRRWGRPENRMDDHSCARIDDEGLAARQHHVAHIVVDGDPGAAVEAVVTQSAMNRQIRTLEDDLGVALFRRRHRALSLTEHGIKLQRTCEAVLGQLRATIGEIRAPSRREVLSLTTTPGFASLWLIPRLPAFTRAHPGIDVRLDASFERRKLRADGFDLAIRYSPTTATEGQLLFRESMQPVCSPKLLRAGPPLKRPEDLRLHTLLRVSEGGAGMPKIEGTDIKGFDYIDRCPFRCGSISYRAPRLWRRPMAVSYTANRWHCELD